jgi:hypothetical protein
MGWARLDDQFWANPKIDRAGNTAAGVFARALCYCSAQTTDGYVPRAIASQISGHTRTINRLISVGLWTEVWPGDVFVVSGRKDSGRRKLPDVEVTIEAHGYYIRDYLHYNRARTDARADESADERANVQIRRADVHSPSTGDARAARPVPIEEPTNPSIEDPPEPTNGGLVGEFEIDSIFKSVADA